MRKWLEKLLCKHEFKTGLRPQKFYSLNGDWYDTVCLKCGKVKESHFKYH